MLNIFRFLSRKARGTSLVDYSLIAAIMAVAGISALQAIGAKGVDVLNVIAPT